MDYDDNDFQSQNLRLAGEGNNKFPPVLRPYALSRFDFDDNLHGHLRFDSLVETEVFLGIESSEDNQWIEDFSRGASGTAFSSAAAEPCSIARRSNVWSEAASSESVEMLLKSVGQDETIPVQIISKDSDACDELGCIIKQMEPSLKHGGSGLSKVGDDTLLQTDETPGKFSGLKGVVGGDHLLVEDVSQTLEVEPSVHGALSDPDSMSRNSDLSVTEIDESKDSKQIAVNENQMNALIDQSVDNRGEENKFASGSRVDTVIPYVPNSCKSSSLVDSQDITHLKNDIVDENVDALGSDDVRSSQEVHIDGENLMKNAVASVTLHAQGHSALDMQSKEDGHGTGEGTTNYGEPSDRIVRGNSDQHMVEACSGEVSLRTGGSEDILSEGKLEDLTPVPFTVKEHEIKVSNPDTLSFMSLGSKMDLMVPMKFDAIEKKLLLESDPSTKTLSSESEKSLLLVEDGKGSNGENEGANDTLGAETTKACDIVTEPNDDDKCDQSVSTTVNLNTRLPSGCINADCGDGGSPLVKKGVGSSSLSLGSTINELSSNLQSDVATSSMSVDCVHLTSVKDLHAEAVFIQKEVQVSRSEASSSVTRSSGMTTEKGAPCEIGEQFSHKKVDQPLSMDDTYNGESQSADQLLHRVTLDDGKDMRESSVICDSTFRETDSAEAQVVSERGSSEASGAVLVQHDDKMLSDSVPSTSKEPSQDTGQICLEETDPKLVSEEKITGHVVDHDVGVTSDSQTKFDKIESGSSADLDNPSCGSPIVIRTSEQSVRIEKEDVKGSADETPSASGVINGEASKGQSISQDNKANGASPGDRSFTFEVPPLADLSEKEAGKNWQPFPTVQHEKLSTKKVMDGTPSTPSLSKVAAKTAQDANLQASNREKVRGGSKGTSERKTKRSGGKTAGKEASKRGTASKETTPARQSERNDRISTVSLGSAGIGQLIQSNETPHYGHAEVFHQPFTDLQQVQLRAQIFVYGALIQGIAPDEAYMISAFGGPDGGRTIWENAWRACVERLHGQKSCLVSPETPSQSHIGAKASDQGIKQNALQSKVTASPASRSTSKITPTTFVNSMIPLSSPLWSIPTPSGDSLQPTGIPRGAVMEYQQGLSALHPPPIRNFIGHNAPWMSQSPFRAPWVPQTSTFDVNARFPMLPMTETVNLTPVREASVPHSSGMKQVAPVPMSQSGSPANIFSGTPLVDSKMAILTPGQHSADPKPRKRKKSAVSEDPGQILWQSKTEQHFPNVVPSHSSAPAAITTPATVVSKSSMEKFISTSSADHLKKSNLDSGQRATLSDETVSKLKEAQKQAEDASVLAGAAVSHSQEIWNQLGKYKNSGLAPDFETKLSSTAAAIAAAAAVAKAAAAAANVAANAGLQAKLMADEALVSISSSGSVTTLGKATPASILRGEDAMASSNSAIIAAREAARRRVEAASAAAKQAENMDAIVKAAELAAEAVSQAGKIVAMGDPLSLTELVEAGPEAYWKVPQPSHEPDGAIGDYIGKSGSVEAPVSSAKQPKDVLLEREKQCDNHGMSTTLREMARESKVDHTRLTDGVLGAAATSGRDKKGQKGRKASDVATNNGPTSESEQRFGIPSLSTQTENEKAGEASKDSNLKEGSHVEVLRDGGGMKVAWFLADILNLKDGKAYVSYNDLRSEDGDQLKEWVELDGEGDRAPRIRITRPLTAMPFEGTRKRRRAAMGEYNWSIGDRVDAWMQDRWWEGVVTEKSKKDETSLTIHFPAQGETSVVNAWLLRPSLFWKNGSWVEWSSSGGNNSSPHEGDTPQEKRLRLGTPAVEAKGKDKLSKGVDTKDSWKPDDTRLLDLYASDRIFNIGKSTRDDSKPDSLRMIRTGLQKEGSRVIFGVPKPGKKRKFMEVSKHYVADPSKTNETTDSAKFTKYLMPQGSGPRGAKNKAEAKDKRLAVSKPKVLKSGKPPTVSGRSIPQKDHTSNTLVSEPDNAAASDVSKLKDSVSDADNIPGKHNVMEFRSFSSSEGPVLFSSVALPSDAPSKKTFTSNAKPERTNKGKHATASGKMAKIEEEKEGNDNSTKTTTEVAEPRRSNRKIQPTSRLLEGLQSSLITSKIPSLSHDKSHKSQSSRSTKGNAHG